MQSLVLWMYKKGQIAIFIILGLILVAGVLFYFLLAGGEKGGNKSKTQIIGTSGTNSADFVYAYADECLKSAAFDAIADFGLQQGYFSFPETSLDTDFSKIAYYYLDGQILIPKN